MNKFAFNVSRQRLWYLTAQCSLKQFH